MIFCFCCRSTCMGWHTFPFATEKKFRGEGKNRNCYNCNQREDKNLQWIFCLRQIVLWNSISTKRTTKTVGIQVRVELKFSRVIQLCKSWDIKFSVGRWAHQFNLKCCESFPSFSYQASRKANVVISEFTSFTCRISFSFLSSKQKVSHENCNKSRKALKLNKLSDVSTNDFKSETSEKFLIFF